MSYYSYNEDSKRDKTITLRASNNDLKAIDGLIDDLKKARLIASYYKYSRMDLIIDAVHVYRKLKFGAVLIELSPEDAELLLEIQKKRQAIKSPKATNEAIIIDCLHHAAGKTAS